MRFCGALLAVAAVTTIAKAQTQLNNPVLNHNFADPTVIQANGKYYAYATNSRANGKFSHIQLAVSTDMQHWEDLPDALPDGATWGKADYWAPHVLFDKASNQYIMFYSAQHIKADSLGKCLGVAFSKSPEGPFVDMGKPLVTGKSFINIDPCAIIDPQSGKKLLYWGSGFAPLMVQELSNDWKSFKPGTNPLPLLKPKQEAKYTNLLEGSWIDYTNGYYYLYYSGDNCCGVNANYAVLVARSKNAFGPFETLGEAHKTNSSVILERKGKWLAPGHNSIFRDAKGNAYIAYHAILNEAGSKGNTRVMLISPIVYKNGWPEVQY